MDIGEGGKIPWRDGYPGVGKDTMKWWISGSEERCYKSDEYPGVRKDTKDTIQRWISGSEERYYEVMDIREWGKILWSDGYPGLRKDTMKWWISGSGERCYEVMDIREWGGISWVCSYFHLRQKLPKAWGPGTLLSRPGALVNHQPADKWAPGKDAQLGWGWGRG